MTLLEDDVADLESDVEDLITDDDLQDERLNTIEEIMNENSKDIDGINIAEPFPKWPVLSEHYSFTLISNHNRFTRKKT